MIALSTVLRFEGVVEASEPLQPLDMAALEQTWPTGEEIEGDEVRPAAGRSKRVRVPKNVGDYERAWLESDTDGSHNDGSDEEGMSCDEEVHEGTKDAGRHDCWLDKNREASQIRPWTHTLE